MDDTKLALGFLRLIVITVGVVLWLPALLFLSPVLHSVRNCARQLAKAEYSYRRRTRHWDGYEPSPLSHKHF